MGCEESTKLNRETAISVKGNLVVNEKSPTNKLELIADFWTVIGESSGDIENLIQPDSGPDVKAKYRHIVHRGEKGAAILKLRCFILNLFREHFAEKEIIEVNPPTIVNTQCEGGSNLFKLDYYGEAAYMTQSS